MTIKLALQHLKQLWCCTANEGGVCALHVVRASITSLEEQKSCALPRSKRSTWVQQTQIFFSSLVDHSDIDTPHRHSCFFLRWSLSSHNTQNNNKVSASTILSNYRFIVRETVVDGSLMDHADWTWLLPTFYRHVYWTWFGWTFTSPIEEKKISSTELV